MRSIAIVNFNIGRELSRFPSRAEEAHQHLLAAQKVTRAEGLHPSYLATTIDEALEACSKTLRLVIPDKKMLNRQTQFTRKLLKLGHSADTKDKLRKSPYLGKGILSAYLEDEDDDARHGLPESRGFAPTQKLAKDEMEFDEPDSPDEADYRDHHTASHNSEQEPRWRKDIQLPKEYQEEEEAIASIFKHKYNVRDGDVRKPFTRGTHVFDENDGVLDAWDALDTDQALG